MLFYAWLSAFKQGILEILSKLLMLLLQIQHQKLKYVKDFSKKSKSELLFQQVSE